MATSINFPALSEVNYPVTSVNGMTGAVTIKIPVESVNGKTGAITLSASDIKALPDTYVPPVTSVNGKTGAITLSASDIKAAEINHTHDYVPTSRTINGKALTSNISLSASDVEALPNTYTPPVTNVNGMTGEVSISKVFSCTWGASQTFSLPKYSFGIFYISGLSNFTVNSNSDNYLSVLTWSGNSIIGIGASIVSSWYGVPTISLGANEGGATVYFDNLKSYSVSPTAFYVTLYNNSNAAVNITSQ